MAPLELSRRMDCITRGSRLLWLKWSTSRCCSVRRMLRPFSTSRLPACHCPLVRFERDVLTSAAGRVQAFARSVSLGEPFDRLPLCQPRNAPFRTGYYTWRVSSHGSRHYYLRDRWRQSANGAVKHTKFLVFHFLRPLAKHVMTSRHVSARPNPDRSRGSDSGAYTHFTGALRTHSCTVKQQGRTTLSLFCLIILPITPRPGLAVTLEFGPLS